MLTFFLFCNCLWSKRHPNPTRSYKVNPSPTYTLFLFPLSSFLHGFPRVNRFVPISFTLRHTRTSTYHMVMGLGAVSFFSLTLTFLQIPPSPLSRCHSSLPPF